MCSAMIGTVRCGLLRHSSHTHMNCKYMSYKSHRACPTAVRLRQQREEERTVTYIVPYVALTLANAVSNGR